MEENSTDILMGNRISNRILSRHFNAFNASLKKHNPKYQELLLNHPEAPMPEHHYICPLCVTQSIAVINGYIHVTAPFSLDHIPPKDIGGRFELLTCKICNNTAGEFEAVLKKKLGYSAYIDKKVGSTIGKIKASIKGGTGQKHKGFLKNDNDGTAFIDFPTKSKENNPDLKFMLDEFGKRDFEIEIEIPVPDEDKLARALLKSADLICFLHWGYEFVYSSHGYKIRQSIKGEVSYPLKLPTIWVDEDTNPFPMGIGIISHPKEIESYYVNVPLSKGNIRYVATVLIPSPTADGWDRLSEKHEYLSANQLKDVTFNQLAISLPNVLNGYTQDWINYINKLK